VLAANGVDVMLDVHAGVAPTPVVSQAILAHNHGRTKTLADGIVITPSHNPPEYGGFKYDPPSGGPADTPVTEWIESRANAFLADGLRGVARIPYERAREAATTHRFDYLTSYVEALAEVIDMDVLRGTTLKIGIDPLGGASLGYWQPIAAVRGHQGDDRARLVRGTSFRHGGGLQTVRGELHGRGSPAPDSGAGTGGDRARFPGPRGVTTTDEIRAESLTELALHLCSSRHHGADELWMELDPLEHVDRADVRSDSAAARPNSLRSPARPAAPRKSPRSAPDTRGPPCARGTA